MNTTTKTPTVHRAVPGTMAGKTTNFVEFDLIEAANEIKDSYVKARILNSLAWRVDVTLISLVRQMYQAMAEELVVTGTLEDYNEAMNMIAQREFAEKNFGEIGSANSGIMTRLYNLLDLREQFVDAATATKDEIEDFWRYKPGTIEEKIFEKQAARVGAKQTLKFEESAAVHKMWALQMGEEISDDFEEQFIKRKEKLALVKAKRLAMTSEAKAPAVHVIYSLILAAKPDDYKPIESFHQLDLGIQEALILSTSATAEAAVESAEEDRSGKLITSMVIISALTWNYLVKRVVAAPKFAQYRAEATSMTPRVEPNGVSAPKSPDLATSLKQQADAKAAAKEAEEFVKSAPAAPF